MCFLDYSGILVCSLQSGEEEDEMATKVLEYSKEFKQRRIFNWLMFGTTYMIVYMGRYNLNATSHDLEKLYGFTHSDYASIGLLGFFIYGVSMLITGPLSDRLGAKKAILIATAGSAVFNFAIGLLFFNSWVANLALSMSLLYGCNMLFQSFIALAVIKGNAPWFHITERGRYGGWFGAILSCGYFMALTVGGFILSYLPIYWVFFIPSALIGLMFLVDYLWLSNKPSEAGLINIDPEDATSKEIRFTAKDLLDKVSQWLEYHRDDNYHVIIFSEYLRLHEAMEDQDLERIEMLTRNLIETAQVVGIDCKIEKPKMFDILKWAWSQKVIRRLTYSEFCTGFVRQGIMYWFILYLANVWEVKKGTGLFTVATMGITVGGVLGAIICGQMSDRVFGSRRAPVAFIFYIMQAVSLVLLANASGPTMASLMIPILAMWIFGVHGMLTGTATMDFGGSRGAATVTAMLDGIQYVASTICVFGMGKLLDLTKSYDYWAYSLVPFALMGAFLMLTIWNEKPAGKKVGAH